MNLNTSGRLGALLALVTLGGVACDDDSTGSPRNHLIAAYGEDFVEDHVPAEETDGWRIEFDQLVVMIADVQAGDATIDGAYAVDLTAASGGSGHALGLLAGGPYARLAYRIGPVDQATPINTTQTVADEMTNNGQSIRIAGRATKAGATLTFDWSFTTDTRYSACETAPTVVGDAVRSLLTIHADHFFYDDLVDDEPNVAFELVASADADADGEVTLAELAQVDITALERYQIGSNGDVTDLRAFIEAQSKTLGHIDGEGHCDQAQ